MSEERAAIEIWQYEHAPEYLRKIFDHVPTEGEDPFREVNQPTWVVLIPTHYKALPWWLSVGTPFGCYRSGFKSLPDGRVLWVGEES